MRELDRLAEDLAILDREIAETSLDDPAIRRLLTITDVNLVVAAGLKAAIGDLARFKSPQKLVSYFGLNPRVHQSGLYIQYMTVRFAAPPRARELSGGNQERIAAMRYCVGLDISLKRTANCPLRPSIAPVSY